MQEGIALVIRSVAHVQFSATAVGSLAVVLIPIDLVTYIIV